MLKPYNKAELSFQLGQEIGQEGQNSKVFIAQDPQLSAELVIKQIPKTKLTNQGQFFEESSALHLSSHPNVVPIHYGCEDSDHIYIAMPYYQNGSLKKLLEKRFLTVREIIRYSAQFISGLHNIHSKKLIHFDIKPDNILINNNNEAVVSDFGLAKPVSPNGLAGQDRNYLKMLPPEAYVTDQHKTSFDIYQTGLTLYRMCCGDKEFYKQFNSYGNLGNFDRDQFKFDVKNGNFPNRDKFLEHIPQPLITTIRTCLQPDPAQRYGAAIYIANSIADIEDELLDWQYAELGNCNRVWSKNDDGKPGYELIVSPSGSSIALKTLANGNKQKINKYCLQSIKRADIKAFLREF